METILVIQYNIKVDVLLGDFDRGFDPEYYREKQYPLEIVYAPELWCDRYVCLLPKSHLLLYALFL